MEENTAPPQNWKEYRRFGAWDLAEQGWKQCAIAVALGVTPDAVSQWLKYGRTDGVDALRHHPAPGPQPKLTPEQRAQAPILLAREAEAFGFRGEVWTTKRVAAVIDQVKSPAAAQAGDPAQRGSHPGLVRRALASTQKGAEAEGRTIVWVDESGFYLLAARVRTYAPRGQTPIPRVPLTRDHLSAIIGTCHISGANCAWPQLGSGTSPRSFAAASVGRATMFRLPGNDQEAGRNKVRRRGEAIHLRADLRQ